MATTNFTKIHNATPDQNDVFKDVKIADKKIDGTCIMFTDLNYYRSCKKDLTKIDEDGKCYNCGDLDIEGSKPDFRCSLIIEIKEKKNDDIEDEPITSIVVFMMSCSPIKTSKKPLVESKKSFDAHHINYGKKCLAKF